MKVEMEMGMKVSLEERRREYSAGDNFRVKMKMKI